MTASQVNRPGREGTSRPASWAPPGQWRLYRAWGDLPPDAALWQRITARLFGRRQHLLYIGITGRTAVARWSEHCRDKWWAPDVATWERDPRIYRTLEEAEAAEKTAIQRERPIHNVAHNVAHNGNNPGAARVRRHLPQHVLRARIRWTARGCVWLALFSGSWLAAADVWHGWDAPRNAAISASITGVVIVAARVYTRRPKRRRKARR